MKKFLTSLLVTAASINIAVAGEVDTLVAPQLPIEAPSAQDWGGFYIGGTFAKETGEWEGINDGVSYGIWSSEGTEFGGFAGFNIQNNNLVFGGEFAYTTGDIDYTGPSSEIWTNSLSDAKARIGYAHNNILFYGLAGWTWGNMKSGDSQFDLSGINYGAGAEMQFGNGMLVGIEYLVRDLTGVATTDPLLTPEYTKNMIALRAGWQF